MNSNSSLDINAVEAFPLEDFSIEVHFFFLKKKTK